MLLLQNTFIFKWSSKENAYRPFHLFQEAFKTQEAVYKSVMSLNFTNNHNKAWSETDAHWIDG